VKRNDVISTGGRPKKIFLGGKNSAKYPKSNHKKCLRALRAKQAPAEKGRDLAPRARPSEKKKNRTGTFKKRQGGGLRLVSPFSFRDEHARTLIKRRRRIVKRSLPKRVPKGAQNEALGEPETQTTRAGDSWQKEKSGIGISILFVRPGRERKKKNRTIDENTCRLVNLYEAEESMFTGERSEKSEAVFSKEKNSNESLDKGGEKNKTSLINPEKGDENPTIMCVKCSRLLLSGRKIHWERKGGHALGGRCHKTLLRRTM